MVKQAGFVVCCALVLVGGAGCGDDDRTVAGDGGACPMGTICIDTGVVGEGGRPDARTDTGGPVGCQIGLPCTPDRGCLMGQCQEEIAVELGGAMDPIRDLPGGGTSVPITYFPDGYCAPTALITEDMPGACDPDATGAAEGCGTCGTCVSFGATAAGPRIVMCMERCTPSLTASGCDRAGYTCDFGSNACFWGCQSDNECRLYREDTDMNGTFTEVPMGATEIDQLVYDTASTATCNMTTGRCESPGTAGAEAGDTCTRDSNCEANGRCLSQVLYDWPGGYCTKFGCDLAGNECAGGGRCMDLGVHVCVQPCTVGAETGQPYVLGAAGHGEGCRDTYACIWNGTDGAGVPNNGGCIPGTYNDIAANNIGGGCAGMDSDSMCYSPYGIGRCIDADAWFAEGPFPSSGYCTIVGCAAPGLPTDVCGTGNQCVSLGGDTTICAKGCTLPDDCVAGYGCVDFDGMETTPKVCFPACAGAADCRATERCDIPSGEMIGRCVTM